MSVPGNIADVRLGHRDRAADATIAGDGMGTAIDAASGYPGTNLVTLPTADRWRTTDATPAKTRAHFELDGVYDLGMDMLAAFNASEAALCRVSRDIEFAERWTIDLAAASGSTSSPTDITPVEAYTVMFWHRLDMSKWNGALSNVAYLGDVNAAATREFLVSVETDGNYRVTSDRWASSNVTATETGTTPLDGQMHHVAVVLTTANLLTLYIDGVSAASAAETTVVTATASELFFTGDATANANVYAGSVSFWNRGMTAAEVLATYKQTLLGTEPDIELLWHVDEGTGTTLADETGNGHGGTMGGGATWLKSMVNPAANYSSGIVEVWQAYKKRAYLNFDGDNDDARTGASLSNSLSLSVAAWIWIEALLPDVIQTPLHFGSASAEASTEFAMRRTTDGDVSFRINRYASTSFIGTKTLAAGWHRLLLTIDGVVDKVNIYWDGTLDTGPTSINSYVAKSGTERFGFGAAVAQSGHAHVRICGDIIAWKRVVLPADDPIYTRLAADPTRPADPTVYLHYTLEDSTTPIVNRGSAGSGGDMTLTGGTWKTDGQSPVDPAGAWLEGDIPGPKGLLRALGYDVSPTAGKYVLLEIWDPDNSDGYVEIGRFASYETYDYLAGESSSTSPISYRRSRSGYPYREAGTSTRTATTPAKRTDGGGRRIWRAATERAERGGHPVLMIALTTAGWVEISGADLAIYGLPVESAGGISQGVGSMPSHPYSIVLAVQEVP